MLTSLRKYPFKHINYIQIGDKIDKFAFAIAYVIPIDLK